MCTGAELGLILAGTGAATNAYNQNRALRKQNQATAQGIRDQGELQRQAAGRTMGAIDQFAQSGPEQAQRQNLDAYLAALRGSQRETEGSLPMVGAANPRFAEDVSAARQATGAEARDRAGVLARIDAPGLQRMNEQFALGRAGADLGELQRQSGAQDFLTKLKVASIQPNPWLGAAGQIMQGIGGAMALMPAAGAAGAAAPTTAAAASPAGLQQGFLTNLRNAQNPFASISPRSFFTGGP